MEIIKATKKDIPLIRDLAEKIWWPTYKSIISEEQIRLMLENMYSKNALKEQMKGGIEFIIAKNDVEEVAFAGYSISNDETRVLIIHKLYVLPSEQGKGTGKKLFEYFSKTAQELKVNILELNVNRANPALNFYQKMGFEIIETVDIPYYQFVLNDYIMRKAL